MSQCPGCGRCRTCGQPTPVQTYPIYPTTVPWPSYPGTKPYSGAPYYVGDVLPGQLGSITVTC